MATQLLPKPIQSVKKGSSRLAQRTDLTNVSQIDVTFGGQMRDDSGYMSPDRDDEASYRPGVTINYDDVSKTYDTLDKWSRLN